MRRVTYQAILGDAGPGGEGGAGGFRPLGPETIATRRRDAKAELAVRLSKTQMRFLREAEALAGKGVDIAVIMRALVDLGRELGIDWALVDSPSQARAAVRDSVLVRDDGRMPEDD